MTSLFANRVISQIVKTLLIIEMGVLVYVLALLIYPYRTVEFNKLPIGVTNKTVKVGGVLSINVDSCRYTSVPTETSRRIVDGIVYVLPNAIINNNLGCKKTTALINIPEGVEPGKYHLVSDLSWKVNPIRVITKTVESEEFTVVE